MSAGNMSLCLHLSRPDYPPKSFFLQIDTDGAACGYWWADWCSYGPSIAVCAAYKWPVSVGQLSPLPTLTRTTARPPERSCSRTAVPNHADGARSPAISADIVSVTHLWEFFQIPWVWTQCLQGLVLRSRSWQSNPEWTIRRWAGVAD